MSGCPPLRAVSSDPGGRWRAVQGWRPVEDLIWWGFRQASVVMANEAHGGLEPMGL